jgi:hypothetical protein
MRSKIYRYWKYFSEKSLREHYRKHYEFEIDHFNKYKDKKPASVQKREMKALQKYWGCYPFQYIRYGFYKNTCKLSIDEMKDYIPNYFAYYLFFPKFFKDYGIITEDKELTYRVLESYKVNQPVLLLQYKKGVFYNVAKDIISEEEVEQIIANTSAEKLFLKPTQGLGGRGIVVFNKKEKYVDGKGNIISAAHIVKTIGTEEDYILQEGLKQHELLNAIYPKSVNTFRIMTSLENGRTKILYTMLRMGQGGNQLDNASQAGLVCKINPETGAFNSVGHTGLGRTLDKHPDTGFIFDGYVFPQWKAVRDFIITTAQKIDSIKFIGWDIAFTETGPAVIEMNAGAGLEYLQDSHGGVRKAYGIDDPKKYWYNSKFAIKDL